jgi:hypothetical protein
LPVLSAGRRIKRRFGAKKKAPLSGILKAGQTMTFSVPGTAIELPNDGGIITLLDNKGLKVHGVSYTAKDAAKEGWTVVF